MSSAFKTYEQMVALATKHGLFVDVVAPGEYRIVTKPATRRRRTEDRFLFQGTVDRYDRAPR